MLYAAPDTSLISAEDEVRYDRLIAIADEEVGETSHM